MELITARQNERVGLRCGFMIVSGYYGELVVTGDFIQRWVCWLSSETTVAVYLAGDVISIVYLKAALCRRPIKHV